MINNKIKIIALIVVLIIAILIIRNAIVSNSNKAENEEISQTDIVYDDGNQIYYAVDENGMVLGESYTEDELYIYQIDPDYNPQNPDTPDGYSEYEE